MIIAFIYLRTKKIPKPLVARIIILTNVQKYFGIACRKNLMWIVKYAHRKGANTRLRGDALVCCASAYGHLEIVKYLHENGADIRAKNDYAVCWASEYGHLEIVKYLHENGANIRVDDDYSIRWASINGCIETVEYLTQFID